MKREEHPVWTLYNEQRTARLNVKYYSSRLEGLEKFNRVLEIILLVSAPTSAVAGLWFLKTDSGRIVWQALGVLSAVIATVRPAYQLTNKIKGYEGAIRAYQALEYDLKMIAYKVTDRRAYDGKLAAEFQKAMGSQKRADLAGPERVVNRKLLMQCQQEVLYEMPPSSFFVPET